MKIRRDRSISNEFEPFKKLNKRDRLNLNEYKGEKTGLEVATMACLLNKMTIKQREAYFKYYK